MARLMDFRMERADLVKPGDKVELDESILKTLSGTMYYYTIKYAIAMSNNTPERAEALHGVVTNVTEKEGLYTVTVAIGEDHL